MRKILGTLGKVLKGGATIVGAVLGVGGVAIGASSDNGAAIAHCISELAKQPDGILAGLGAVIFLFGFGRKAGWIGREQTSTGKAPS